MRIPLCGLGQRIDKHLEEAEDFDAENLSYVGHAAYDVLRKKHARHLERLWDVAFGNVIGQLHQTPINAWPLEEDPKDGNDDWFPGKMGEILSRTKVWCDVMSLSPPDGLFIEKFKEGLKIIYDNAEPGKVVTIRMMFGNIVGMPVNCEKVLTALVKDLPEDAGERINVWVGAWRKGVSWNHAKLIAVDGRYLHTGGHNMWDPHYLKNNPVHDLSLEMEGRVTHAGHLFANCQWEFVESKKTRLIGKVGSRLPDALPIAVKTRCIVRQFPRKTASEFPPVYERSLVPEYEKLSDTQVIAVGRLGSLLPFGRPADDAFVSMILSAKRIIRMALQDLGPVCIPGTKQALPGCTWPKNYLSAIGKVVWTKGVEVQIVVSNPGELHFFNSFVLWWINEIIKKVLEKKPLLSINLMNITILCHRNAGSIPGGLNFTEACYGNGWSCVDVCAEIIKTMKKQFPDAEDHDLRIKIEHNIKVCFIRHAHGTSYSDGKTIGMHAKHFIIDDICTYIGSQNLYVCDLAEWGVIIDNEAKTKEIMEEYWSPMWKVSYTGEDVDVADVMEGLNIDRNGKAMRMRERKTMMENAARKQAVRGFADFYDSSSDDEEDD
mmetsp:Transcript_66221/g.98117  ORF Transcript_66221/g.98117 Transcript_66221/m.98117 type:complete len:604 (+) Transcript_66221:72-1883(+)